MKFTCARSLCFAAALLPLLATAQTVPLQPGEYEVTAWITFSNVQEKAEPDTNSRCIKAEDLANVEAVFNNRFMAGFKADASCKVSGLAIGNGMVGIVGICMKASSTAPRLVIALCAKRRATGNQGLPRLLPMGRSPTTSSCIGLVEAKDANVESYVTRKALDGLYLMIADEERAIRRNPLSQSSKILQSVFGALGRWPANPAPSSIRPARDDADERTLLVRLALELDRLAADLAVFDVSERARRQVHRGLEPFATKGALHGDKLGCVHRGSRATRLKHWLEPVQRIDGLRIEWFARLPGHVGNLHRAKPGA